MKLSIDQIASGVIATLLAWAIIKYAITPNLTATTTTTQGA